MTRERFDQAAATWDEKPLRLQLAAAVSGAMKKALPLNREMQALEIGCGTGLITTEMAPLLKEILATDTSDGMLAAIRAKITTLPLTNITTRFLDLTADPLPLPAQSFDLIYSSMVFHHIKETGKILQRCRELLRRGGILSVADLAEEDGTFHEEMPDVAHFGFNPEKLSRLAQQAGFGTITFRTVHVVSKEIKGEKRDYPIFLMTAR